MGCCCYKCCKNDLFKSTLMEDPEPNHEPNNKFILIKENAESKSYISEEKNKFPSQQSVFAFNQNIKNQKNKKPEKVDTESKNTDNMNSCIYEIDDEGIYSSEISDGNN